MVQGLAHSILGVLVQLTVFLWIFGLGFSVLGKHQSQYFAWTKKTLKGIWDKQWKLIIGILIGWLLSFPATIQISSYG